MSVLVTLGEWEVHERLLSSTEVLQRAGITYRQLDYWCRTGLLKPVEAMPGSGNAREFPDSEVRTATALGRLASLDRKNGYRSILAAATTAIRRGERTFELIPGITVDLIRLGA